MFGGWWVQQGSRTKLRTEETKVNPRETIATLRLWLTERRETTVYPKLDTRLAVFGRGEGIWQQLLSSETWEPETEVLNICCFQVLHRHRWFPPPLNPRLFSIFVSGMISSCLFLFLICFVGRDRAHLNGESTLSMFAFLINAPYHCAHPWMCLTLEFGLFSFPPHSSHLDALVCIYTHFNSWWSHISRGWIHGGVVIAAWDYTWRWGGGRAGGVL